MQAEVEIIREMSETLESANFTRDQSDAFIQSVALAMKTFAVSPEAFDDRFYQQQEAIGELKDRIVRLEHTTDGLKVAIAGLRADYNGLKHEVEGLKRTTDGLEDSIDGVKDSIDGVKDSMHSLQRSLQNYLLGFTLVILAGLLGTLGVIVAL